MLPRRHASIDVLWLTVLFTSTAILAVAVIHRPFTIKVARQHEKPLHLLFQQCCKILWTEPNVQRNKEFPLRERKWIGRQPLIIPRGGGQQQPETDILAAQQHVIPITSLPLIDTKSVSLALRLTCETNRRLHRGTSITAGATTDFLSKHHTLGQHVPQHRMSPTLCTHTIRSVPESEQIEERRVEELTLFHCMDLGYRLVDEKNSTEWEQQRKSFPCSPDLESYLNSLLCAIGIDKDYPESSNRSSTTRTITHNKQPMEDESQVILSLTILYLDRSTSLSSPHNVNLLTGQQSHPQCPYILPQTVHRLLLTALTIATKLVRGDKAVSNTLREAANSLMDERHAISLIDMEKMESWMLHAVSSATGMHTAQHHHHEMQISHDEISRLLRKWGGTFYPQRLAAHDQARLEQQESVWRDQLGANHGHGNFWADRSSSLEYPTTHDGEHHWQYPGHF